MITRKENIFKRIYSNPKVQAAEGIALPLFLGLIILILWQTQVLHALFRIDVFVLPVPSRIISIALDNLPKIWDNIQATIIVSLSGLFLGSILGYFIAVVSTVFKKWGRGGLALVSAFNAIPIVALAPVMTNWTKDVSKDAVIRSMVAKILVVMIVCTANMSINAFRGLTELKPFALDLLTSYAAPKSVVYRKLLIPNSVPYILTALRVSVPASVISALVSEYFAEYIIGIGRQIRENIVLAQYATAWVYITVACLVGIILYGILMIFEGILLKSRKH